SFHGAGVVRDVPPCPTRRSSDLPGRPAGLAVAGAQPGRPLAPPRPGNALRPREEGRAVRTGIVGRPVAGLLVARRVDDGLDVPRSEEHTSELQSLRHLVCRLLLE